MKLKANGESDFDRMIQPWFSMGITVASWWLPWIHTFAWIVPAAYLYFRLVALRASSSKLIHAFPPELITPLRPETRHWLRTNSFAIVLWRECGSLCETARSLMFWGVVATLIAAWKLSWWWLLEWFLVSIVGHRLYLSFAPLSAEAKKNAVDRMEAEILNLEVVPLVNWVTTQENRSDFDVKL